MDSLRNEERLLGDGLESIEEATTFVGLSRSTLYGLMDRGELPYVKIGRRRLIPRAALVDLARRGLISGPERSTEER
jgi:excisionase family DNA binding protein